MKNILLVSKEVLRPDYLSCYGGKLYKTHNIDSLARQGTIFTNFYTASPSSAMAFTAMFTGLYPFETQRKLYREVKRFTQCPTLSDLLEDKGYEIHVIWGGKWFRGSHKRSRVFSSETQFHNLEDIYQTVGPHAIKKEKIPFASHVTSHKKIYEEVKKILENRKNPAFIWLHCPHVFLGRNGYGSDIDVFDNLVGMLFDFFSKDEIYLTGDHGHMNCEKGIPVYGFHVYEGAVKIPLVTPNHFGAEVITDMVSNVQLKNIIVENRYETKEYIYSDTQYYLQENRRLMIRKGDFKYIFNKKNRSEEFYDLKYDPGENVNLLMENWEDRNRDKSYYLEEIYYYPRWDKAENAYVDLRREKDRIWREGKYLENLGFRLNNMRRKGFSNISRHLTRRKNVVKGRWDSKAQSLFYEK